MKLKLYQVWMGWLCFGPAGVLVFCEPLQSALTLKLADTPKASYNGSSPGESPAANGPAGSNHTTESPYPHRTPQITVDNTKRQSANGLDDEYLVGVGIADITGPSADINLMGYAKPNQDAGGIHLRQFSRAIVIEDNTLERQGKRILYVSIDNGMVSQLLRNQLLLRLAKEFGASFYNESNVMISATHTHSCPGGFFQYLLYNIPAAGFVQQSLDALVEGIIRSIRRASENMQPSRIFYHEGELLDASINRSPTAYANNPTRERAAYKYDTDKQMQLLRFVNRDNEPIAMINWFAVHGTSMNSSNRLISSDNKGYASLLFERDFNGPQTMPGKGKFVALFAQANEGDVSPNTRGPRCTDSGLPCDEATSTCGNPPRSVTTLKPPIAKKRPRRGSHSQLESAWSPRRLVGALWRSDWKEPAASVEVAARSRQVGATNQQGTRMKSSQNQPIDQIELTSTSSSTTTDTKSEKCVASGPGRDQFESTKIIAYKQYYKARELFLDEQNQIQLRGGLRFVHEYIDITKQVIPSYRSAMEPMAESNRNKLTNNRSKSSKRVRQNRNDLPLAPNISSFETCLPALGYSFAAGTTDGPGAFDFQQGDTASSRYWNTLRDLVRKPSAEQTRCHHPKPIFLSTGEMDFPYMWHPRIVPTQIFMIGQLAIVGLPGEFTTMAGRRVREAVRHALYEVATRGSATLPPGACPPGGWSEFNSTSIAERDDESSACRHSREQEMSSLGGNRRQKRAYSLAPEIRVALSGLSNIYTSYVTTIEEYEVQRYEGASTLYGPHTLQAYVHQFRRLARQLMSSNEADQSRGQPQVQPPDLTKSLFTLKPGVLFDSAQHGHNFGDCLEDVATDREYSCGDTVQVSFAAANPRNELRQEDSFLYVERYLSERSTGVNGDGGGNRWQLVANDACWETKFIWERTNVLFGESKATIVWEIPYECSTGIYRIRHAGSHKNLLQTVAPYKGSSRLFRVRSTREDYQQSPTGLPDLEQLFEEALAFETKEQQARQVAASASKANSAARNTQNGAANTQEPHSGNSPSFYSSAINLLGSLFGSRQRTTLT